jgi:hypothetical protein
LAVLSVAFVPSAPTPEPAAPDERDAEELVYVDIDIEEAPEAPEAHVPVEPEPVPEPEPVIDPDPIVDPLPDPVSDYDLDAGVPPDALDFPEQFDAGAVDPQRADHDADVLVAIGARDAGPHTATATGASGEGGTEPIPAGAAADLAPYAPEGDIITVLLRLDRIRGTPWESRVRAIVEPMPDYQAIIGGRDIELADHLDLLVISSFEPQAITATTLAARSRGQADALRQLLAHEHAPITWRAAQGGTLGERRPGPAHHQGDPRVYLLPAGLENWLVLARPEQLGAIVTPGQLSGSLDDLPAWLRALPAIAAEAGEDEDGPIAVVSARGFPDTLRLPRLGILPAPRHMAMAVEIDPRGFRIRGTLTFASEERAEAFERVASEQLPSLVDSVAGRLILRQMHAYNAARGLSFQRVGDRVGYATSVSIADGRAALAFAAEWTARYFGVAAPAPEPSER